MNIYTIIIADDHSIFLKGLALMLNEVSEFKVIGEASNGEELIQLLQSSKPDVVITDIKMPGMNGIEATKKSLEIYPDLNIIALTMFSEQVYLNMMAEAGAKGFIQKNISREELVDAVKTVCAGNTYFSAQIRNDLATGSLDKKERNIFIENINEHFTPRELRVLHLIAKGFSTQEIAAKMFISPRTVEGHRANLISKTGTKNVVDLAIYAIKNHLVEID